MIKPINKFFLGTWKIQKTIIKYDSFLHSFKGTKFYRIICFITYIIFPIIFFIFREKFSSEHPDISIIVFENIIMLLLFFTLCAYDILKMFTSLSRFLLYGFVLSGMLFLMIKNFPCQQLSSPTDNIVIEICFFLVWCGLSLIANSTVSIAANSIISGVLAILILLINTLILMIPTVYPSLPDYSTYLYGIKVTYTFQQKSVPFRFQCPVYLRSLQHGSPSPDDTDP